MDASKILQTVQKVREKLATKSFDSISTQQRKTTIDTPAKGPVWVSRTELPVPSDSRIHEAVQSCVKELADGDERWDSTATARPVKGQWVGCRSNAAKDAGEPDLSEREKYSKLVQDAKSDTVIFYIFGGAFYSGGPATARPQASALATLTGGRSFVTCYRLAPQHSFPAPLVDLLLAYVSLLHPPKDAFHKPVAPSYIVIAGDSVGGALGLSLLHIIKRTSKIRYNGVDVEVGLPAGFAAVGCQTDHTHAFPSYSANAKFDLLEIPQPLLQDKFPSCDVWPTSPPRGDIYCETSALTHPLVSPARFEDWRGFPPMWFSYGQEQLLDDGLYIAQKAHSQGVAVQVHQYALLPHIFPMLFPMLPQSKHVFKSWAAFCRDCVGATTSLESRNISYEVEDTSFRGKKLEGFSRLTSEEARKLMNIKKSERKTWTGQQKASI